MAERGATPTVSPVRRRALDAVRSLFTPLLPDDYLELINPLWSTQELRGRIERIERETPNTVTVMIKPGHDWPGHEAGQYVRVGVIVDGKHHWRAYSLTSEPHANCVSVTPRLVESGVVSPYLVRKARPGDIVRLGGVEGSFVLPRPRPKRILFLSAGSGITPIMSMLRALDKEGEVHDVFHIHSERSEENMAFRERLRDMESRHDGYTIHLQLTGEMSRIGPDDLDELCPDWRDRKAFLSGPSDLLDTMLERWEAEGVASQLHMERFQPKLDAGGGEPGEGGTIMFLASETEAESDGTQPILVAGEEEGLELPYGCREGICHTCIGKLCSGQLRDLRNGQVHGTEGEMVRTCINAPEGRVEIDL
jgi:stearoyl-CoA 9-desaturase NADPH oxidoreductase